MPPVATIADSDTSAVSWAAIAAGGVAAASMSAIMVALGAAVGLAMVSPWEGSGVSATTFKISVGIFLVITAIIANTVGGYIAGRLRTKWMGAHTEEVLFRDTAHGFLSWAFALILGALVSGGAATMLGSGLLTGASAGASAGGASASVRSAPTDYYVDTLLRREGPAATVSETGNTRQEVQGIFARGFARPEGISAADRSYLAQIVAQRTGRSPQEAEVRVTEAINNAKVAADEARKFSAAAALWLTIAMLAGAFAASAAALEGGQLRDGRWRGVVFHRNYHPTRT